MHSDDNDEKFSTTVAGKTTAAPEPSGNLKMFLFFVWKNGHRGALLFMSAVILLCAGCDQKAQKEAAAQRDAAQKAAALKEAMAKRDAKIAEGLNSGVLTNAPAWAQGYVPPSVNVDALREDFELGTVLIRYRVPPDDPKEYLEYAIPAKAKQDLFFTVHRDGKTYVPWNSKNIKVRDDFKVRLLRTNSWDEPFQLSQMQGGFSKGTETTFLIRLSQDQLKGLRAVVVEDLNPTSDLPPR